MINMFMNNILFLYIKFHVSITAIMVLRWLKELKMLHIFKLFIFFADLRF
jgi:hypothetical protein